MPTKIAKVPVSPIAGSGGIVDPTRFGQVVNPNRPHGGIVQNIPRKQGRIQPHTYSAAQTPQIFGWKGANNPDVPDLYSQPGTVGDVRIDKFANRFGPNPMEQNWNVATMQINPPLEAMAGGNVVHSSQVAEVQPHEKGNFFSPQLQKINVTVRNQGGINPKADTAFHPQPRVVTRPVRRPAHDGKSIVSRAAPSFTSFNTIRGYAQADTGSRWDHVKKGVVE